MNSTYETNGNLAIKPVRRKSTASVSRISTYLPPQAPAQRRQEEMSPVEEMLDMHGAPLARSRSDERFAAAVLGAAFLFLITLAGLPVF